MRFFEMLCGDMLPFNQEKTNCTGCSACYSVCPIHCIEMKKDEEGFLYPCASDACLHCGLCELVCPSFQLKKSLSIEQKAMAAVSRDDEVWRRSASGGAFSEICRIWADDDTLIVGAAWDDLRVRHIGVSGYSAIAPLCKSKYIESDLEDTFLGIREALSVGRKAIFCGCPCQVAGLKAFLRKDFDNLLTIDLICHGQGSQSVFEECIKIIGEQLPDKVQSYQFRAKRRYYEEDYISSITTRSSVYYVAKDQYMQLFLSQRALRPSCGENCKYRDRRRPGDLTIADFKGLTKVFPDQVFPKKNWSTVVCNTAKGEKCFDSLRETMSSRLVSIDQIIKYNPLFAKQTWFSKDRDIFFHDFVNGHRDAIIKWTLPFEFYKPNLFKIALQHLPLWIKEIAYRCYNNI